MDTRPKVMVGQVWTHADGGLYVVQAERRGAWTMQRDGDSGTSLLFGEFGPLFSCVGFQTPAGRVLVGSHWMTALRSDGPRVDATMWTVDSLRFHGPSIVDVILTAGEDRLAVSVDYVLKSFDPIQGPDSPLINCDYAALEHRILARMMENSAGTSDSDLIATGHTHSAPDYIRHYTLGGVMEFKTVHPGHVEERLQAMKMVHAKNCGSALKDRPTPTAGQVWFSATGRSYLLQHNEDGAVTLRNEKSGLDVRVLTHELSSSLDWHCIGVVSLEGRRVMVGDLWNLPCGQAEVLKVCDAATGKGCHLRVQYVETKSQGCTSLHYMLKNGRLHMSARGRGLDPSSPTTTTAKAPTEKGPAVTKPKPAVGQFWSNGTLYFLRTLARQACLHAVPLENDSILSCFPEDLERDSHWACVGVVHAGVYVVVGDIWTTSAGNCCRILAIRDMDPTDGPRLLVLLTEAQEAVEISFSALRMNYKLQSAARPQQKFSLGAAAKNALFSPDFLKVVKERFLGLMSQPHSRPDFVPCRDEPEAPVRSRLVNLHGPGLAHRLAADRSPFARAREAAVVAAFDVLRTDAATNGGQPSALQALALVQALEEYERARGGLAQPRKEAAAAALCCLTPEHCAWWDRCLATYERARKQC